MSLINDALKKAQRDRSGENPPAQQPPTAPPPPSSAHTAPAATSSGFKAWPIVVAVAIVVVGFLGWRMFAPSKPADTVATTTESAPTATAPASSTPAPVAAQPEPQPVASAPTTQPTEATPSTTTVAPATETPAEVATTTPAATAPAVQAQPAPASEPPPAVAVKVDEQPTVAVSIPSTTTAALTAAPQELPATVITIPDGPVGTSPAATLISLRQQDPRILAYLDALRVNGIRPSPDDPKALMNNRVFRIGDVVDRELNLRLTSIAPNKLGFEDDRGMPYLKSF
ncbi:MAG TPA: hypothetical protein VMM36_13715 [Opitutaceae bacterium]|nr:hypothetical protein [Opitutaceae bacterium]